MSNKYEKDFRFGMLSTIVIVVMLLSGGCATVPQGEVSDPLEGSNRQIFDLNSSLDRAVIKPVADTYVRITPQPVRNSVSNFFDNISYLNVILNDVLQGKLGQSIEDSSRFVVNSTIGVLGLFDPATSLGMVEHNEDFGQTLGVWGADSGSYLVIPLLGPNTVRDSPNLVVSAVTNLLFYLNSPFTIPLGILSAIDARARVSGALKFIDEAALDPYIFVREAYYQQRTGLIFDGNPPLRDFDGELAEEDALPGAVEDARPAP